ncbi:MAG TPA: hypothetical protein VJ932_08140, partial [Alkalispirochaeta sp.]|nr:hypothetical protein [Alkalispirochaeta sp.]
MRVPIALVLAVALMLLPGFLAPPAAAAQDIDDFFNEPDAVTDGEDEGAANDADADDEGDSAGADAADAADADAEPAS